ncbi:MFS-type transporter SLC18B1-like isoform X2 [Clytia hemisphaerica]
MPKVGVKFSLIAGGFLSGGSNILFGFLDYLYASDGEDENGNPKVKQSSYLQFVIFCFALRTFMAIGTAFNETAAVSIMTVTFKHALSTAQGSIALFTGLGLMAGPAIGSALYQLGNNNFLLPFVVIGSLVWLVILMIAFILPPENVFHDNSEGNTEQSNFWKVFLVPGIFMMSTVTLIAGMVISFLDPTLTPFVQKLDPELKPFFVGLIFLCAPMTYAISTPFLGRLLDKKIIKGRNASIIGCFLGFICYLFMAPSPLFAFIKTSHLWLTVTSLLCLGFLCLTAMFVPVLADMQITARKAGLPMNLSTDAILSGIYTSMFYIGSIVGPALGAFLTQHLGFPKASTIFAFLLLLEGVCLLSFTLWENKYGNGARENKEEEDDDDREQWREYREPNGC